MAISRKAANRTAAIFTLAFVVFVALTIGGFIANAALESSIPKGHVRATYYHVNESSPSLWMNSSFIIQNGVLIANTSNYEGFQGSADFSFSLASQPENLTLSLNANLPDLTWLRVRINDHLIITMILPPAITTIDLMTFGNDLIVPGVNIINCSFTNDDHEAEMKWIYLGPTITSTRSTSEFIEVRDGSCFIDIPASGFSSISVTLPPGTSSCTVTKFPEKTVFVSGITIHDQHVIFSSIVPPSTYQLVFA